MDEARPGKVRVGGGDVMVNVAGFGTDIVPVCGWGYAFIVRECREWVWLVEGGGGWDWERVQLEK